MGQLAPPVGTIGHPVADRNVSGMLIVIIDKGKNEDSRSLFEA